MLGYLRRLATTGFAYTASSVFSKVIAVLLLPLFSFNDGTIVAFPIKGWTLQWYRELGGSGLVPTTYGNIRWRPSLRR